MRPEGVPSDVQQFGEDVQFAAGPSGVLGDVTPSLEQHAVAASADAAVSRPQARADVGPDPSLALLPRLLLGYWHSEVPRTRPLDGPDICPHWTVAGDPLVALLLSDDGCWALSVVRIDNNWRVQSESSLPAYAHSRAWRAVRYAGAAGAEPLTGPQVFVTYGGRDMDAMRRRAEYQLGSTGIGVDLRSGHGPDTRRVFRLRHVSLITPDEVDTWGSDVTACARADRDSVLLSIEEEHR